MADHDDDDEITRGFIRLTLEDGVGHSVIYREQPVNEDEAEAEAEDDYYIHIDIQNSPNDATRNACARRINSYMLRQFYFDPRRYHGFFDTVFEGTPTLRQMRNVCGGMSASYRELWKVRRNFDVGAFYNHFAERFAGTGITINLCIIQDNGHSLLTRTY